MKCRYPDCNDAAITMTVLTAEALTAPGQPPSSNHRIELNTSIYTCVKHQPKITDIGHHMKAFLEKRLRDIGYTLDITYTVVHLPLESARAKAFLKDQPN